MGTGPIGLGSCSLTLPEVEIGVKIARFPPKIGVNRGEPSLGCMGAFRGPLVTDQYIVEPPIRGRTKLRLNLG